MNIVLGLVKLALAAAAGGLISVVLICVMIGWARVPPMDVDVYLIMWSALLAGGLFAYFFSFGFVMLCLAGLWLGFISIYLVIFILWPGMNYEEGLVYLFNAGFVGVLLGGLVGRYKLRAWRRVAGAR